MGFHRSPNLNQNRLKGSENANISHATRNQRSQIFMRKKDKELMLYKQRKQLAKIEAFKIS